MNLYLTPEQICALALVAGETPLDSPISQIINDLAHEVEMAAFLAPAENQDMLIYKLKSYAEIIDSLVPTAQDIDAIHVLAADLIRMFPRKCDA